jgi:mannosyltransferase
MKIVFDNIIFSLQKSGGISVYWYELICRFNKSSYDITFVRQKNDSKNIFGKLLTCKETVTTTIPTLFLRFLPIKLLGKEKTIVHSSYYRYAIAKNAINVITIHDFTPELFFKGISRFFQHYWKKSAIKHANAIICISENTKKDLLHFFPAIQKEKICVIYNGVSSDFYKINDKKSLIITDLDVKSTILKKYVLFVGHRTSYKNFLMAAEAVALHGDDLHFAIVGEPLNADEQKKLNALLPQERYTILSKKNNEVLNILYNFAHCFLYPSAYEGFGIPILEAMNAGCPVICSNNSSIPEVAGNAALMIEDISDEKIKEAIKLLDNNDKKQEIVEKGFEQAKFFSWNKTHEEVEALYKKLWERK